MKKNEKKQPLRKVSSGRISVTVWNRTIERNGASFELQRACVQHSRKDRQTSEWRNQQIWLNIEELRDLANALDKLNEEGVNSPSSSSDIPLQGSIRAHHIVEYIKANSLDAGLDVLDLEELSADGALNAYGIHVKLNPSEETLVLNDLKALVEQKEFAEIAHCVNNCSGPLPALFRN